MLSLFQLIVRHIVPGDKLVGFVQVFHLDLLVGGIQFVPVSKVGTLDGVDLLTDKLVLGGDFVFESRILTEFLFEVVLVVVFLDFHLGVDLIVKSDKSLDFGGELRVSVKVNVNFVERGDS